MNHSALVFGVALACATVLNTETADAACAPPKLVRLVITQVDVTDPSKRGPKRVIWRLENGKARIEEPPNSETGIHLLSIVNAPLAWQIDLNTKTGMLAIDPEKPPKLHMPIFSDELLPKEFEQYELGCERVFIADPNVQHETLDRGMKHFVESGPWRFTMLTRAGQDTPLSAVISRDGKTVVAVQYTGYQFFASPPPGHFLPPPDIKIDDAPKKPAPGI
jgi:hypothetical protein